jgi:hypothetical protein
VTPECLDHVVGHVMGRVGDFLVWIPPIMRNELRDTLGIGQPK